MKDKLKALRARISALAAQASAIVAAAEKDDREYTAEETQKLADVRGQIGARSSDGKPATGLRAREEQLEAAIDTERDIVTTTAEPVAPGTPHGKEAPAPSGAGSHNFNGFGQFIHAVAAAGSPSHVREKLMRFNPALKGGLELLAAASGGSEAIGADGGFLVPPDFSAELIKQAYEVGRLVGKVRRIPVAGNRLTLHAVAESSRATGSRWGGVQVYRAAEAATVTAKKPTFREMNLVLKKLMGLAYATEELLEDVTAMESIYRTAFSEEIAWVIDDEIINGDGAGEMLGILNSNALISVTKETAQAAATLLPENIVKMYTRMPARNRSKAEFYCNQDIETELILNALVIGTGGILPFLPPGGFSQAPSGSIFGRPLVPIEQCAALGTVGDIIFADLSEYVMIEKGAPNWQSSMHVRFIYDEMTFKLTVRNDGQPTWDQPVTSANSNTTRSPFVALQTRA